MRGIHWTGGTGISIDNPDHVVNKIRWLQFQGHYPVYLTFEGPISHCFSGGVITPLHVAFSVCLSVNRAYRIRNVEQKIRNYIHWIRNVIHGIRMAYLESGILYMRSGMFYMGSRMF